MKKFSVVVPFTDEKQNILRTYDFIKRQHISFDEIEMIIVENQLPDLATENLMILEDQQPQGILVVEVQEKKSLFDLINIGLSHAAGEYVVFVNAGDAINDKLFAALEDLCAQLNDTPDIFSFNLTNAMESFEYFMDDPFDTKEAEIYYLSDVETRRDFLKKNATDDSFLCHAYRRQFLIDADQPVSESLVYPLYFIASSVCVIPENGYCKFGISAKELSFSDRIAQIIETQTNLYELLASIPEIMSAYGDCVTAHFIRNYYLKTLYLAKALDINNEFNLTTFQALQYVCLKVAPKWIENEVIYSFSQKDKQLLQLLYREFKSDSELQDALYKDALVSTIMGTYNRADKLPLAVENLLSQTYQRLEIIIIDDGSTDETANIAAEFKDPRIKFIQNDHNMGPAATRNVGIKESKGSYLVVHDDDDLCRLEKIWQQMEYFWQDDSNVGMVYHETINHINRIEGRGEDVVIMPSRNIKDVKKNGFIFPALLPWNFVTFPSMMVARESYEKVGLLDESLIAFEDWEITLRIAKEYRVGFIKKPLYDYYQSSAGTLFNDDLEHRKKVVEALDHIDKEFQEDRKSYGIESIKK